MDQSPFGSDERDLPAQSPSMVRVQHSCPKDAEPDEEHLEDEGAQHPANRHLDDVRGITGCANPPQGPERDATTSHHHHRSGFDRCQLGNLRSVMDREPARRTSAQNARSRATTRGVPVYGRRTDVPIGAGTRAHISRATRFGAVVPPCALRVGIRRALICQSDAAGKTGQAVRVDASEYQVFVTSRAGVECMVVARPLPRPTLWSHGPGRFWNWLRQRNGWEVYVEQSDRGYRTDREVVASGQQARRRADEVAATLKAVPQLPE